MICPVPRPRTSGGVTRVLLGLRSRMCRREQRHRAVTFPTWVPPTRMTCGVPRDTDSPTLSRTVPTAVRTPVNVHGSPRRQPNIDVPDDDVHVDDDLTGDEARPTHVEASVAEPGTHDHTRRDQPFAGTPEVARGVRQFEQITCGHGVLGPREIQDDAVQIRSGHRGGHSGQPAEDFHDDGPSSRSWSVATLRSSPTGPGSGMGRGEFRSAAVRIKSLTSESAPPMGLEPVAARLSVHVWRCSRSSSTTGSDLPFRDERSFTCPIISGSAFRATGTPGHRRHLPGQASVTVRWCLAVLPVGCGQVRGSDDPARRCRTHATTSAITTIAAMPKAEIDSPNEMPRPSSE